MILIALFYIVVFACVFYLAFRFVRGVEQIAEGVKQIADQYEQKK
jgi:hypothetical protein